MRKWVLFYCFWVYPLIDPSPQIYRLDSIGVILGANPIYNLIRRGYL
jgi:hypothetical protein